jgi:hypothetical protein
MFEVYCQCYLASLQFHRSLGSCFPFFGEEFCGMHIQRSVEMIIIDSYLTLSFIFFYYYNFFKFIFAYVHYML